MWTMKGYRASFQPVHKADEEFANLIILCVCGRGEFQGEETAGTNAETIFCINCGQKTTSHLGYTAGVYGELPQSPPLLVIVGVISLHLFPKH